MCKDYNLILNPDGSQINIYELNKQLIEFQSEMTINIFGLINSAYTKNADKVNDFITNISMSGERLNQILRQQNVIE